MNAGKGSQDKSDQKRETVGGLKRKMKNTDSKLVLPTAAESEESANHVCVCGLPRGHIPISAC